MCRRVMLERYFIGSKTCDFRTSECACKSLSAGEWLPSLPVSCVRVQRILSEKSEKYDAMGATSC